MKKMLSCLMATSMLFISGMYCPRVFADETAPLSWTSIAKKQIMTSSGVTCKSEINVSNPVLDGQSDYRRKVEIKNDFFVKGDKKCISTNLLSFYFSYNNNGVSVDGNQIMVNQDDDLTKRWKTSSSEEIYNTHGQSIVSQRIGIYNRETLINDFENTDAFHIDVICSKSGEVTFNIKSLDGEQNDVLNVSNFTVQQEKLKKKLSRMWSEKTLVNAHDLQNSEDDLYRYITKEFHVVYTNHENKILGETTVQACFRYNKNTREVQCLSTSHEENSNKINVYMRSGNETRTYGGAYGEIKVKYPSGGIQKTYKEVLIIKCDSNGDVVSKFLN